MLNGRNSLPQERTHQLVVQYQMVSTENIHASNNSQEKQAVNLKESKEGYMGECKRRKGETSRS